MLKLKMYLEEVIRKQWIKIIVCFAVGIVLAITYLILNEGWANIIAYSNGFFIGGACLILTGGLSLVNKAGGLDIFQFMFNTKRNEQGVKETLYEYSERKRLVRSKEKGASLPYFVFGIFYVLISLILLLIAA